MSVVSLLVLVVILPYLPDQLFPDFPLDPAKHETPKSDQFFTKVKWNTLISDKAKRIGENTIIGPESMAMKGDSLFTGLADGRLVEINKNNMNQIKTLTRFHTKGSQCGDSKENNATLCGRILGLKFAQDGNLYFVEATKGLHVVTFEPSVKVKHVALGPDGKGPNKITGVFNDVAIDPNNPDLVYVSVSTTKWHMDRIVWSLVDMNKDGLVLAVNVKTGKHHIIMDDLVFTNGMEISPNKRSLLVAEWGGRKIYKIDLADIDVAIKSGKPIKNRPTLIDNLPGGPDNIRVFGNDLYIGMPLVSPSSTIHDRLSSMSAIRKSLGRLANLASRGLVQLDRLMKMAGYDKCGCMLDMARYLDTGAILHKIMPADAGVLIIDGNTGKIRRILGSSGYPSISEALLDVSNGDLYLGSYRNAYIGKISGSDLK